MRLTVLGNNGPFPEAGGACSSYMVEAGGLKILVDMGSGALSNLQKQFPLIPDVIILTHLHYDHIGDYFLLQYALGVLQAQGKAPNSPLVLLPKTPEEIAKACTKKCSERMYITEDIHLSLSGVEIGFCAMPHPVECYAVSIEYGKKRLVYSADTSNKEAIAKFAEGADLLLIDGGLLSKDRTPASLHLSVAEACEVGRGAKKTVLTHLSPLYARQQVQSEVTGGAQVANIGDVYEF